MILPPMKDNSINGLTSIHDRSAINTQSEELLYSFPIFFCPFHPFYTNGHDYKNIVIYSKVFALADDLALMSAHGVSKQQKNTCKKIGHK